MFRMESRTKYRRPLVGVAAAVCALLLTTACKMDQDQTAQAQVDPTPTVDRYLSGYVDDYTGEGIGDLGPYDHIVIDSQGYFRGAEDSSTAGARPDAISFYDNQPVIGRIDPAYAETFFSLMLPGAMVAIEVEGIYDDDPSCSYITNPGLQTDVRAVPTVTPLDRQQVFSDIDAVSGPLCDTIADHITAAIG